MNAAINVITNNTTKLMLIKMIVVFVSCPGVNLLVIDSVLYRKKTIHMWNTFMILTNYIPVGVVFMSYPGVNLLVVDSVL